MVTVPENSVPSRIIVEGYFAEDNSFQFAGATLRLFDYQDFMNVGIQEQADILEVAAKAVLQYFVDKYDQPQLLRPGAITIHYDSYASESIDMTPEEEPTDPEEEPIE